MKGGIIISETGLGRRPGTAFTLSFFFTGLGQIYNGDPAKGIVFLMLRIFAFVFPVAVIILKNHESYISFFGAAAIINILIWAVSSFEAMYAARGLDVVNLKRYNSPVFYIIYSIIATGLIIASIFFVSLFVSVEQVSGEDMAPSFFPDEYVMINKYSLNKYDIGDAVVYSDEGSHSIGRIIAKSGEEYRYEGGRFYINDFSLQLGILSAEEMKRLGLTSFEELFYETNGKRRYPVKVILEDSTGEDGKKRKELLRKINPVRIKNDMLLVSCDNRTSDNPALVIASGAIKGRVEGVFYTFNFRRLFLKPYLDN